MERKPEVSYQVWSQHADPEPRDVLETRRTDKAAALEDVNMLRTVCHRRAWIQEIEK
jgi:hypothetical protein